MSGPLFASCAVCLCGNLSRMYQLIVLMAAFAASPVTATATTVVGTEIEEVLVTATRRKVTREEVSSGLTLVRREHVQKQKLVTDALASNIGVFLQQTTPGQGAAIIRGLKGSSILHLVDGMRLNNAMFRSAPTQYFALVPTTAVERVEVIRGTPTSLYGNDAVGGVVQLVTRIPNFESSDAVVRGDAMLSFDTAELAKIVRATIDAGNRSLESSFSAEYQETGNRRTGRGERVAPSGYESKAVRFMLAGRPADNRSWFFDAHYLEQPETPRVDELVPGFGQTEASSSEFLFAPNRRAFVHARYEWAAGPASLDWNADVAWQRIDDDRVTRDLNASDRRHESNSSDLYGMTITGSRKSDAGSWVIGAELYNDDIHSSRLEESLLTGVRQAVQSRFPNGSTADQAAIFGNVQILIGMRHKLSGGARVSNNKIRLPETDLSAATSIDDTDISGDVGWIFEASENWWLLANAGLGFRTPNVFDLGTLGNRPGNRFNIPNTTLESERVSQIDVGVRYRSERMTFDFMTYALRYDDRITSVGTGDVTADGRDIVQSVNALETSIHGIEAGARIHFTEALSARAILNYTWGEQEIAGAAEEPAGRIPPMHGMFAVSYDNGGDVRTQAWVRFAGEQDRLSARDVNDVRIDPQGSAGWVTVGASAEKTYRQNWILSASLDNLFDKRYRVHGSGLDAPGRNLVLSVRRVW